MAKTNHEAGVQPRLIGIKDAAKYLGCTIWAARSLAWNKAVPHVRIGSRVLFDRTDLDRYIDAQKMAAA